MELNNMSQHNDCDARCDNADLYVNKRIIISAAARSAPPGAEETEANENSYEQLRFDKNTSNDTCIQRDDISKTTQWEDIPDTIKYKIYVISAMLIVLYIAVLIVIVITALPKREGQGGWSQWSSWDSCSVSCDAGLQQRNRSCSNTYPEGDKNNCLGGSRESRECIMATCSKSGWSLWESWGACSDSCGGGVRIRSRSCTKPTPPLTGQSYTGDSIDISTCNRNPCPAYNVSFMAYHLNTSGKTDAVLQFLDVHLNNGNAYNRETGQFTCKIPGVYSFTVTLTFTNKDKKRLHAYLKINSYTKLTLLLLPSDDDNDGIYPVTTTGHFHLNLNDVVNVYGTPNIVYANIFSSSFTGVLLTPDH